MNFFLDGRINRAEILFPGVFCFLVRFSASPAAFSCAASSSARQGHVRSCSAIAECA